MMKLTSFLAAACLLVTIGCHKNAATTTSTGGTAGAPAAMGTAKLTKLTTTDVKIGDNVLQGIKVGNDAGVKNGDMVSVEYTGTLDNGTVFDTNVPGVLLGGAPNQHAKPLTFFVGRGQVVQGFDQGMIGMKLGGERKIGIPPSLGYGPTAQGPIPGNSDLNFDIKLLDIVRPGEEGTYDSKDLAPGSGNPIKKGDTVQVEYTVKLADGTVVDTNVGKNPFLFTIGEVPSKVISGLEQGVTGMKPGGVRLLRIPPAIGYGTHLVNSIPAYSTLVIQVKILSVM